MPVRTEAPKRCVRAKRLYGREEVSDSQNINDKLEMLTFDLFVAVPRFCRSLQFSHDASAPGLSLGSQIVVSPDQQVVRNGTRDSAASSPCTQMKSLSPVACTQPILRAAT